MPANVEAMFSVRETPWHGLGRIIMDAPASREALELAGLDWQVESRNIYSGTGAMIPGYRANVRSTDMGVVSDRYRIVQNKEAFQFTDDLLGEGVTYETAGSLQGGKKVWMLARLPRKYLIAEGRLEERYWNHLRVQNNILDFLYDLWVGSCHSLAADFSTIMKDLVEYDFILAESIMKERMQSA